MALFRFRLLALFSSALKFASCCALISFPFLTVSYISTTLSLSLLYCVVLLHLTGCCWRRCRCFILLYLVVWALYCWFSFSVSPLVLNSRVDSTGALWWSSALLVGCFSDIAGGVLLYPSSPLIHRWSRKSIGFFSATRALIVNRFVFLETGVRYFPFLWTWDLWEEILASSKACMKFIYCFFPILLLIDFRSSW